MEGIIGAALGLLGVFVSLIFSAKLDKRNKIFQEVLDAQNKEFQLSLENERKDYDLWKKKYEILIQLMSYRYDVSSDEYTSALNGVSATFYDSKKVIAATKKLYNFLETSSDTVRANEFMVALYVEIFNDLGISENVDETFLNKCFNGK